LSDDTQLEAWARAAAAGDRAAAERVLEAIQDRVFRLALRMLGHPQDAEDATQEILVVVLTHLGSFRGESALGTWVWRHPDYGAPAPILERVRALLASGRLELLQ
jgi:hypothetical protein